MFTYTPGQVVVYAGADVGLDGRFDVETAYAQSGAPLAYISSDSEQPSIGGASLKEAGSVDSVIGWARWAEGTTGGRYYADEDGFDIGPNQGVHIVSGDKATDLPSIGSVAVLEIATRGHTGETADIVVVERHGAGRKTIEIWCSDTRPTIATKGCAVQRIEQAENRTHITSRAAR